MKTTESEIPEGFGSLFRTSPLLDALGPFYGKGTGADLTIGLRVAKKHTNSRGTVHGGVLATLGDVVLGYTMAFSSDPPRRALTASLTIDYVGAAKIGDWIEARVDKYKVGKTLAFANAYLTVDDTQIARVSAVFAIVPTANS
ncbi:MAG TPA: PaaI family thioesterase [Burkholderiales bacterium]|nr:PaaI family thioesterase [Burkholderiales bacterium]